VTHAATDSSPPTTTPIFASPKEAARLLSLSRSRIYELMDAGLIESVRIGGRRVIPVDALHDFATRLREG
jgi:excisionase family DNA binding protein